MTKTTLRSFAGYAPKSRNNPCAARNPCGTAAARNFALSCVMGALFAFGGLLYVVRLPERRAPGKYDYVLNSHQLFHTLTVVAALLQHRLVMQAYAMAHAEASVLDESFSVFDA